MIVSELAVAVLLAGASAPMVAVAVDQAATGTETVVASATVPEVPVASAPPAAEAELTIPAAVEAEAPAGEDEIVVSGQTEAPPGDPLARVNAQSFEVTQEVDDAFVAPVAMGYKAAVPAPLRTGLRNVLRNLQEPVAFVNFLLQLKPGRAMETLARFTVNSTIGIAGLVDVAKDEPFHLPRRPNGLGNTLGFYGVGPGPFLFLPLVGPTTVRDLIGGGIDRLLLPTAVGQPFNELYYTVPTSIVATLDRRVEIDDELDRLRSESADPYAAFRENYLRKRQEAIDELRGKRAAVAPHEGEVPNPVTAPLVPAG